MENPYIVVEQKQEKKRRGALAILLAIAFCAILAIGSTFAYLTWTSNQTANRMTTNPNVTADLLEPMWSNALDTAGTESLASDNTVIPAAANNMVPGSVVAKNPFMVNTTKIGDEATGGEDVYVGMKLQFQKWVATAGGTGTGTSHTETGTWVNMSGTEVAALMKVYAFTSDTTTATTAAGFNTTANALGQDWVQYVNGDSANTAVTPAATSAAANATGAMYFFNNEPLRAETASEASKETAKTSTEVTDVSRWNIPYTKLTNPVGKDNAPTNKATNCASSELFKYIRYVDGASQEDINTLNGILKKTKATDSTTNGETKTEYASGENKTTDPGWRVVVSGAAIQAAYGDSAYVKKAADFMAKNSPENWTTLLDATSATDGSSEQKPYKATGWRASNTNFQNIALNNEYIKEFGVPSASQIRNDGNWVVNKTTNKADDGSLDVKSTYATD